MQELENLKSSLLIGLSIKNHMSNNGQKDIENRDIREIKNQLKDYLGKDEFRSIFNKKKDKKVALKATKMINRRYLRLIEDFQAGDLDECIDQLKILLSKMIEKNK